MKYSRGKDINSRQYYIGNDIVSQVDGIRDLGVFMDSKLKFENHLYNIVIKANGILGGILRSSEDFKDDNTLICLYKALVRPILEYGSVMWDPIYNY